MYSVVVLLVFLLNSVVQCYNHHHHHHQHHHHDHNHNDTVVSTGVGRIRGTVLKTRLGKPFYAFRGIRYAKPPVDELRFQAPQPVDPWTDIFDATDDGPMCPQPSDNVTGISEDCLRLNVYTSELPSRSSSNVNKPVIIYMHPGGFYVFSGQSKNNAGPQLWMDRDIVLVTINYRLGTLGYLATGTKEAPGNAGYKDQVMAMRWVKQHISKFGGDPNSVTLVGYSAGALSITLHMVSPMSRNLFHKAVVMSAAATAQWQVPTEQIDLAERQAGLVGCPKNSIEEMVQCLKKTDIQDYARTLSPMFDIAGGYPVLLWKPVIEPDFGQERFLTEDPTKSYQNGNFMRIPVIAGVTNDEFAYPAAEILKNDTLRNDLDTDFEKYAPIYFMYERDTPNSRNISQELRAEFLGNKSLSSENSFDGLHYLFADSVIGFHVHRFVHLASKFTTVYYYKFTYQGRYSFFYYPDNKPFGVVHHDDLLYLLYIPSIAPLFTKNDPEDTTVERLTRMWSNFAKTGNPNKPNDEYLRDLRWRPFNSRQENYLDIGNELVMKQNLYTNRYAVWDHLFPLKN